MEALEKIFELVTSIFSGLGRMVERSVTSLFGSANARYIKRLQPKVDAINALEPKYEVLSDDELRAQTVEFQQRIEAGETLDDLLVEAFAVCREAGKRFLGMRHYDVQLIGGMVLHEGNIAEMVTGEGKTLVATLPSYLNGLTGKGVHVVTVNDYLARRDMEWMGPLHMELGLTVGAIQSDMDPDERQKAYACDVTYGTNNEFGFDYLRDNMRSAARDDDRYPKRHQQAQGKLNYAIVDEVDNILIDEARTPLIISGPAADDITKYSKADQVVRKLKKDVHFELKEKEHSCHMTDEGVREAERIAGVESFYTAGNMHWPHLLDNSLKAHHLYKIDVNYVIQGDEIVIVDEFTGRLMPGRNWSDGLHQAVEAKEGVRVKEENQTLATITLQNFFKLYNKISGMTGTAMTEATEFWKIYQLDVIAIPTNREMKRFNHADVIYRTEHEKFVAIADEIEKLNRWTTVELNDSAEVIGKLVREDDEAVEIQPPETKKTNRVERSKISHVQPPGRPILVGTVSIEKSERISRLLEKRGVKHEVLNAKHHKREAEIVSQAGRLGAVTIATNMAGRGTDIVLGGNPETKAWAQLQEKYSTRLDVPRAEWDALVMEIETTEQMKEDGDTVKAIGGLHVIGTERHEARRIDLQLRGRCGRQGDPGGSRFFLSLEDDLMRIFAGEWVKNMLTRLGMKEGEAIESRMVSRRIEGAQKKVEERNFEVRKNLLEYDEVMDEQRKRTYGYRQRILDGANCRDMVMEMIVSEIDHHLGMYLDREYGADAFAKFAGDRLGLELEGRDFRRLTFDDAERVARDKADRHRESQVLEAMDETLPIEEDPKEWTWEALAKTANTAWGMNVRDRDLKKIGRDDLAEHLIEHARQAIVGIDLSDGEPLLREDYGIQTSCKWIRDKFDLDIDPESVEVSDTTSFVEQVHREAQAKYDQRETEFPIMAGMVRFAKGSGGYDRDALAEWAAQRFDVQLSVDDLKNKQRDEVERILIEHSLADQRRAGELREQLEERIAKLFGDESHEDATAGEASTNGQLMSLADWLTQNLQVEIPAEEIAEFDRESLENRLIGALNDRFHPEIRRMERALLLEILDTAWKDHLLVMGRLRDSIGLAGYAQIDPKVEYKREGMKLFEQMWGSFGEQVTDLAFRMEQLDEDFVGSTWQETEAVHEEAGSSIAAQQEAAIDASGRSEVKAEPIRNIGERVGRNDPCPCGSGKKYKNCHMRSGTIT